MDERSDPLRLESLFSVDFVEECRIVDLIQNDPIRTVAESYLHNMENVALLAALPISLVKHAEIMQIAECKSFHEVTGTLNFDPATFHDNSEAINTAYEKNAPIVFSEVDSPEWLPGFESKAVYDSIAIMGNSEQGIRGTIAWLESLTLNSWTAFETMAADLWERAVNACPKKLASLEGKPHTIGKKAGVASEKPERTEGDAPNRGGRNDETKSISLEKAKHITGGTFNLGDHMGTLLKGNRKFTTLSGIREAYSMAFSDHAIFIEEALSDKSLDALSLVRNLLVHKAAIADEEYVSRLAMVPLAPGNRCQFTFRWLE